MRKLKYQYYDKADRFTDVLIKRINKAVGVDITIQTRRQEFAYGRFLYCYFARKYTRRYPLVRIGKKIGIHHATVLYGFGRACDLQDYRPFEIIFDKIDRSVIQDVINSN